VSEFLARGLLTAFGVALVMHAARRVGLLAGGAVAGLPVTTLPSLLWLAAARGEGFAAQAAIGSVIAAPVWATCAIVYAAAARRMRPIGALASAMLLSLALAAACSLLALSAGAALLLAVAVGGLALQRLNPAPIAGAAPCIAGRPSWLLPVAAGGSSALVSALALALPPLACGLLASLPIIGLTGAWLQHQHGGTPAVVVYARGYVAGLIAKAAFCALFAELLLRLTWPLALGLAAVSAVISGALLGLWARAGAWRGLRWP
jgi:hypothetical protein